MAKPKPLSNRQRKAQRKTAPKSARGARSSVSASVAAEPRGVVAREAVREEVIGREVNRLSAAVACGDLAAEDALGVKVDMVGGADMVAVDRRGDRVAGAGLRLSSRDGLVMLHRSGTLTDALAKGGLAFRLIHQSVEAALGSCLGRVGEGRGARDWSQLAIAVNSEGELELMQSAADLHRAYVVARLNQIERAVFGLPDITGRVWLENPDGHELGVLRRIAGEGHTVREVAGASGHAREVAKAALVRALTVVAGVLRITGQ